MGQWALSMSILGLGIAILFVQHAGAFPRIIRLPEAAEDEGPGPLFNRRRRQEEEGPKDPHVPLLEKLGAKLNQDWLKEDVILSQRLDRINDISKVS